MIDHGNKYKTTCTSSIFCSSVTNPVIEKRGNNYHDGKLYHEREFGREFGPKCTKGDRMGCGLQFSGDGDLSCVNVFFTKNGCIVGSIERMQHPLHGFYPLIGLHSVGEKVRYLGHWRRLPDTLQEPMEEEHSPSEFWLRSNGIWFTEDKLTLEYAGNRGVGQDVAMALANFPISLQNHYFELEILENGVEGAIAIGLGSISYPLHRHPGWNSGGIGYHADDGQLFKGVGIGKAFGPKCSAGDKMGCGVRFSVEDDNWETESIESGSDYRAEEIPMDSEDTERIEPMKWMLHSLNTADNTTILSEENIDTRQVAITTKLKTTPHSVSFGTLGTKFSAKFSLVIELAVVVIVPSFFNHRISD